MKTHFVMMASYNAWANARLFRMAGALAVDEGVLAADVPIAKLDDNEYETCLAQIPEVVEAVAHYWRVRPPTERERTAGGGATSNEFSCLPARRGGRWVH